MSYLEIKLIKAVASVHRGTVKLAHASLVRREKNATKRKERQLAYAADLQRLAAVTAVKADDTIDQANYVYSKETREINAATNTVLNLRDDLNKIS
jgi:hypothetical protein